MCVKYLINGDSLLGGCLCSGEGRWEFEWEGIRGRAGLLTHSHRIMQLNCLIRFSIFKKTHINEILVINNIEVSHCDYTIELSSLMFRSVDACV